MIGVGTAGADRLARDLVDAADDIADTREPDTEAAELLRAAAYRAARKVTGRMARGIKVVRPGVVEALEEYSPIIHEGYRGISPNPFFDQAVESTPVEAPYVHHVEQQLEHNIRRTY